MATQMKTDYLVALRKTCSQLAVQLDLIDNLYAEFFAKGYNSGGVNELTDEEVQQVLSAELVVTDVGNLITLMENLKKLINNQTPTTGDYATTINKWRQEANYHL